MSYVKIKIQRVASHDDLKKWEDRMLEKVKCWNKFCLGVCDDHELRAVYVVKEDNEENIYLTTLREDCIKETADYGLYTCYSYVYCVYKRVLLYIMDRSAGQINNALLSLSCSYYSAKFFYHNTTAYYNC